MRYIFLILFGIHLFSSVALASDLNSFDTQIVKNIQLTETDSTEIYQNLIAEENFDANYIPNVVGIVFGSVFTGTGTFFLVGGILGGNYSSGDAGDEIATKIAGGVLLGISIPFLAIGVPLLAYNIYQYNVRKNHANKRDEYIRAYKRYESKKKKESVQWMIFPSVDFVNSNASLNAVMLF